MEICQYPPPIYLCIYKYKYEYIYIYHHCSGNLSCDYIYVWNYVSINLLVLIKSYSNSSVYQKIKFMTIFQTFKLQKQGQEQNDFMKIRHLHEEILEGHWEN